MVLYYAEILDYKNQPVIQLEYTVSAKHSAFIATKFLKHCPPAQGFAIKKKLIESKTVCKLFNQGEH